MARTVIADSESDEDPYSLPPSPPPLVDLTTPVGSQHVDEAAVSTDPSFFQSVLDEQTHKSAGADEEPAAAAAAVGRGHDGAERESLRDRLTSSEITAPGTFHRTVTAFDVSTTSSATNPATQGQLARAQGRAEKRSPWELPSSSEEESVGLKPRASRPRAGKDRTSKGRKRRRAEEADGDGVDLIAFPGSPDGLAMPSTLQLTPNQPRDEQAPDNSGDTNPFSSPEQAARPKSVRDRSTTKGQRSHFSPARDPLATGGVGTLRAQAEEPDGSSHRRKRASRQHRNSSPDEFAHTDHLQKATSRAKTAVILVDDESDGEKTAAPQPKTSRSAPVEEEESDFEDPEAPKLYAEEDYEEGVVEKPKKKTRGRPSKKDKAKDVKDGAETGSSTKGKGKRGRPKKANAGEDRDTPAGHSPPAPDAETLHQEPVPDAETLNQEPVPDAETLNQEPVPDTETLNQEPALDSHQSPEQATEREETVTEKQQKRPVAGSGKPLFRVGLSKRSRIAPLLKSLKKT